MRYLALTLASSVLLMSACGVSEVREADRDLSGTYDGSWVAIIDGGQRSWQSFGTWRVRCESKPTRQRFAIDQGTVTWAENLEGGRQVFTTYVSDAGDFRVEVPFSRKSEKSHRDGAAFENFRLTYEGRLGDDPPEGRYTFGYAQFNYEGCKYKLRFERA